MITIIRSASGFKNALIRLSAQFNNFCFIDSSCHTGKFSWIAGISLTRNIMAECKSFYQLKKIFLANKDKYIMGHINYDLKNIFESLSSDNHDGIQFGIYNFFVPDVIIIGHDKSIEILWDETISGQSKLFIEAHLESIYQASDLEKSLTKKSSKRLKARTDKKTYFENFKKIRNHIQRGDIYEINYCLEFFNDNAVIEPSEVYLKLIELTQPPMGCFYKNENKYLMCASPERFLKKENNRLISQPIKGTIKRGDSANSDENLKAQLYNSEKERAENVMIVDLIRNDLSRIAKEGSVSVDELFGIYSFKTVHQMISTVSCELRNDVDFTDIIRALFPMGSMTGAPKIRAMELIEKYENAKRGLFSGSVGYIAPDGDFDFNVVIRSILYNAENNYVSSWAGSAITAASDAENEYEECLLKLKAMKKALE